MVVIGDQQTWPVGTNQLQDRAELIGNIVNPGGMQRIEGRNTRMQNVKSCEAGAELIESHKFTCILLLQRF
jgi:hypothetical protein